MEPSPSVVLQVGNNKLVSTIKDSATNPKWEEKFEFLFSEPELQQLSVEVIDNSGGKPGKCLGRRKMAVKDLLTAKDMTIIRPYSLRDSAPDSTITLRLRLRVRSTYLLSSYSPLAVLLRLWHLKLFDI